MSTARRKGVTGLILLVVFGAILVLMFMPILRGQNALEYLDDLYNSISKGSAYYFPALREEIGSYKGHPIEVALNLSRNDEVEQTALLYSKAGCEVSASGDELTIEGDLGKILAACLDDAEAMYENNAKALEGKYGYDGRRALRNWWYSLNALEKGLTKQKLFKEAKVISLVRQKAVETSYNYFGVEPQRIRDRIGVVIFSLLFYVVYTLWYGYAIMYLFEEHVLSILVFLPLVQQL